MSSVGCRQGCRRSSTRSASPATWPLCGHHHLSTMPTDDDERTTHE